MASKYDPQEQPLPEEKRCAVEEVALVVPETDDPSLPVMTFRAWFLGLTSCVILVFLNTFFKYRTQPLTISAVIMQIAVLPVGKFMAATLPEREYSVLGYGWAGMFRRYLVDPVEMWWPANLTQVSLFRALHEKEPKTKGMTRMQFFLAFLAASFAYYTFPGYLFPTLTFFSWVCWVWPHSITAQQIGSGYHGLGVGAFTLDWAGISAYRGSPLVTPWSSILNVGIGFIMFIYVIVPLCYWKYNTFDARKFPIFSNQLFTTTGQKYDTTKILTPQFDLNTTAYDSYGKLYLSPLFALSIGSGFARFTVTLVHVALYHGRDIWKQSRTAVKNVKLDVHAKLMRSYKELVGTLVSGTVNLAVSWWMLESIDNLCDVEALHPESPWTCPKFRVTFDASVIWGLIGPE
ncbi:hypothetical protein LguiB_032063 [Lonicera macranthoides]